MLEPSIMLCAYSQARDFCTCYTCTYCPAPTLLFYVLQDWPQMSYLGKDHGEQRPTVYIAFSNKFFTLLRICILQH